jgi:hypothetical protein
MLWVAAALWPSLYGGLQWLLLSPFERALRASWCGATPHDALAFLGHCLACWVGAALLASAGAMLMRSGDRQLRPAGVRAAA